MGSGARYLVSLWMSERFGEDFPWGTLAVNVLGSLLLAVLVGRAVVGAPRDLSPSMELALTTGLMGGFTTFSTFSVEVVRLFERGESRIGAAYLLGTLVLGVGASFGGFVLGRWSAA